MTPAPTIASALPKRKRAVVSYYEASDSEGDEGEDFAADSEAEGMPAKKAKKTTKTATSKPLPKKKIFPFNLLPAELKNQIYELALRDLNDIYLVAKTRKYRRTVQRDSSRFPSSTNKRRRGYWSYARWQQSPTVDPETPTKIAALVPNIMLLNRDVYAETQPILYGGNKFFFEDTAAMHAFLANIGSKNCAALSDLTVKGWALSRSHKALNHPAFTLLGNAVNLTRLHIDCIVHYGGPRPVARQFFRDAYHFLHAMSRAKGTDLALTTIEMQPAGIKSGYYFSRPDVKEATAEEDLEAFRSEIRELLSSRRY